MTTDRFLRMPQVRERVALSKAAIYRKIGKGEFPPPVKLGERVSAWPESAIQRWMEERIAARIAA
ncbi:helix-turn-helix transcriptional regulator [Paracoccus endophyticus]|uniref:helix-turn-helix transcriptional regulator n=1 Tax=Paracoccus endophyticus TaxID=2233774 RepID=UPI000DD9FBE4|nr:AlpA family transcriptional regulator [Paracoccus endophyticus]